MANTTQGIGLNTYDLSVDNTADFISGMSANMEKIDREVTDKVKVNNTPSTVNFISSNGTVTRINEYPISTDDTNISMSSGKTLKYFSEDISNQVNGIKTLKTIIPKSIQNGRWGNEGEFISGTYWYAVTYSVSEKCRYYINGYNLENATYKILFIKADGTVISRIEEYQTTQPLVDYVVTIPENAVEMRLTVEIKIGRSFYVKAENVDNTKNTITETKNLLRDTVGSGVVAPINRYTNNRWGSDGSLVSINGYNAYKFNVNPNGKYYINGFTLKDATSRILLVDSIGLISYYTNYQPQPLNYYEIVIPEGIYNILINETDVGDGNLKLFNSTLYNRLNGVDEILKDGVAIPVELNKNNRWAADGVLVSINGYNAYRYSVKGGEEYYLNGYTLEDVTSKILFKKTDGTIIGYTSYQTQPLNFYKLTIPYDTKEMLITETDKGKSDFELYKTGIIKKSMSFVDKKFDKLLDYPSYFNTNVNSAVQRYQSEKYFNDSDSFIFLTDVHYKDNQLNSIGLIKGILKITDLTKVFCGGDTVYAYGTTDECKETAYKHVKYFASVKGMADYCCVRGNHDFTIKHTVGGTTGYTAPFQLAYNSIMANVTDKAIKKDNKMYYYLDNNAKKIRYVFVDTNDKEQYSEDTAWGLRFGISTEQETWLTNEALNVQDGWSVVVVGHISCVTEISGYNYDLDNLANILKDYKNRRNSTYGDFTNSKGELVGYICGHNHKDENATVDNVLFVSTGCDACIADDVFARARGTDTEQLFDIFIIDKGNKVLKTVRVGAGQDRSFSY